MLAHPLESLGRAGKEMAASPPAGPAELAFVARNLSDTVAAVGRIAQATGEGETAAMSRLLAPRLREVADALSAGVGVGARASRGEVVTVLSASAVTRLEAEEDVMGFAEAAGISGAVSAAIRGLNSQVRAGLDSGRWQHVDPSLVTEVTSLVEMSSLLEGQASRAVISGKALGRRSPPAEPMRVPSRQNEHDGPAQTPGRSMGVGQ